MNIKTTAERIAEALLAVKAVKLQPNTPFTWASGWKSPIYCDNRVTLSSPSVRTLIKEELANVVRNSFGDAEVIAGVAIEGELPQGSKVLVIEDLISTGGSSLKAVEALRQAGSSILGMVAVYTHGFPQAVEAFEQAAVPLITLSNYDIVITEALATGYISQEDESLLKEWRKSPATWTGKH